MPIRPRTPFGVLIDRLIKILSVAYVAIILLALLAAIYTRSSGADGLLRLGMTDRKAVLVSAKSQQTCEPE